MPGLFSDIPLVAEQPVVQKTGGMFSDIPLVADQSKLSGQRIAGDSARYEGSYYPDNALYQQALQWENKPYKQGQTERCADFVSYAIGKSGMGGNYFRPQMNVQTLHQELQEMGGESVTDPRNLQPGDVVFFGGTYTPEGMSGYVTDTHTGIYAGNGEFIHRPTADQPVKRGRLSDYDGSPGRGKYEGAVRISRGLKGVPSVMGSYTGMKKGRLEQMTGAIARAYLGDSGSDLFVRQIAAESNFDPTATSYVGAKGMAQFMPETLNETLKQFNAEYGKNYTATDYKNHPNIQAELGAYHMRNLLSQNGGNWSRALAAYNAGQGHVDDILRGKTSTFSETRNYVSKILGINPADVDSAIISGKNTPTWDGRWVDIKDYDNTVTTSKIWGDVATNLSFGFQNPTEEELKRDPYLADVAGINADLSQRFLSMFTSGFSNYFGKDFQPLGLSQMQDFSHEKLFGLSADWFYKPIVGKRGGLSEYFNAFDISAMALQGYFLGSIAQDIGKSVPALSHMKNVSKLSIGLDAERVFDISSLTKGLLGKFPAGSMLGKMTEFLVKHGNIAIPNAAWIGMEGFNRQFGASMVEGKSMNDCLSDGMTAFMYSSFSGLAMGMGIPLAFHGGGHLLKAGARMGGDVATGVYNWGLNRIDSSRFSLKNPTLRSAIDSWFSLPRTTGNQLKSTMKSMWKSLVTPEIEKMLYPWAFKRATEYDEAANLMRGQATGEIKSIMLNKEADHFDTVLKNIDDRVTHLQSAAQELQQTQIDPHQTTINNVLSNSNPLLAQPTADIRQLISLETQHMQIKQDLVQLVEDHRKNPGDVARFGKNDSLYNPELQALKKDLMDKQKEINTFKQASNIEANPLYTGPQGAKEAYNALYSRGGLLDQQREIQQQLNSALAVQQHKPVLEIFSQINRDLANRPDLLVTNPKNTIDLGTYFEAMLDVELKTRNMVLNPASKEEAVVFGLWKDTINRLQKAQLTDSTPGLLLPHNLHGEAQTALAPLVDPYDVNKAMISYKKIAEKKLAEMEAQYSTWVGNTKGVASPVSLQDLQSMRKVVEELSAFQIHQGYGKRLSPAKFSLETNKFLTKQRQIPQSGLPAAQYMTNRVTSTAYNNNITGIAGTMTTGQAMNYNAFMKTRQNFITTMFSPEKTPAWDDLSKMLKNYNTAVDTTEVDKIFSHAFGSDQELKVAFDKIMRTYATEQMDDKVFGVGTFYASSNASNMQAMKYFTAQMEKHLDATMPKDLLYTRQATVPAKSGGGNIQIDVSFLDAIENPARLKDYVSGITDAAEKQKVLEAFGTVKKVQGWIEAYKQMNPATAHFMREHYAYHKYPRLIAYLSFLNEHNKLTGNSPFSRRSLATLSQAQREHRAAIDLANNIRNQHWDQSTGNPPSFRDEDWKDFVFGPQGAKGWTNKDRWEMLVGKNGTKFNPNDEKTQQIIEDIGRGLLLGDFEKDPAKLLSLSMKSAFHADNMNRLFAALENTYASDGVTPMVINNKGGKYSAILGTENAGSLSGDIKATFKPIKDLPGFRNTRFLTSNSEAVEVADYWLHPDAYKLFYDRFLVHEAGTIEKHIGKVNAFARQLRLTGSPIPHFMNILSNMFVETGFNMSKAMQLYKFGEDAILNERAVLTDALRSGVELVQLQRDVSDVLQSSVMENPEINAEFMKRYGLSPEIQNKTLRFLNGAGEWAGKTLYDVDHWMNKRTLYDAIQYAQIGAWQMKVAKTMNSDLGQQLIQKHGLPAAMEMVKKVAADEVNRMCGALPKWMESSTTWKLLYNTMLTPKWSASMLNLFTSVFDPILQSGAKRFGIKPVSRWSHVLEPALRSKAQSSLGGFLAAGCVGSFVYANIFSMLVNGHPTTANPPDKYMHIKVGNSPEGGVYMQPPLFGMFKQYMKMTMGTAYSEDKWENFKRILVNRLNTPWQMATELLGPGNETMTGSPIMGPHAPGFAGIPQQATDLIEYLTYKGVASDITGLDQPSKSGNYRFVTPQDYALGSVGIYISNYNAPQRERKKIKAQYSSWSGQIQDPVENLFMRAARIPAGQQRDDLVRQGFQLAMAQGTEIQDQKFGEKAVKMGIPGVAYDPQQNKYILRLSHEQTMNIYKRIFMPYQYNQEMLIGTSQAEAVFGQEMINEGGMYGQPLTNYDTMNQPIWNQY